MDIKNFKEINEELNDFLLLYRKTIAFNVTKYRKKAGLTLKALGKLSGLVPDIVSKVEHKQSSLELDTILKLSYGLKISPMRLFEVPEGNNIGDTDFYQLFFKYLENLSDEEKQIMNNKLNAFWILNDIYTLKDLDSINKEIEDEIKD